MIWCWLIGGKLLAQPERLLYFPDSGRAYAAMDPGQEILQRNVLISNQAGTYSVSFALSFDEETWQGFALGPRFSSIYNLLGQGGCYIRVRTQFSQEGPPVEVVYYLIRGKCYSVYWNGQHRRWDVVENPCRM